MSPLPGSRISGLSSLEMLISVICWVTGRDPWIVLLVKKENNQAKVFFFLFPNSKTNNYFEQSPTANTDLDMSGEEAGEGSTLARLASSLWMAEASEVGLAAEPGWTERMTLDKPKSNIEKSHVNSELKDL